MTLPVNKRVPSCQAGEVGPMFKDGTRKDSMLKVSISKTLFDSCTTLRNPSASSNFGFHSDLA